MLLEEIVKDLPDSKYMKTMDGGFVESDHPRGQPDNPGQFVEKGGEDLKVGVDYGSIFGLEKNKKQQLIYKGGDKWLAINGDKEKEMVSSDTTKKAIAYINKPTINMSGTILRK